MNEIEEILTKLIKMKCENDEFEDMLIDVDSIKNFLELLPDDTVIEINESLEMYVQ